MTYSVNGEGGYVADVSYTGEAQVGPTRNHQPFDFQNFDPDTKTHDIKSTLYTSTLLISTPLQYYHHILHNDNDITTFSPHIFPSNIITSSPVPPWACRWIRTQVESKLPPHLVDVLHSCNQPFGFCINVFAAWNCSSRTLTTHRLVAFLIC